MFVHLKGRSSKLIAALLLLASLCGHAAPLPVRRVQLINEHWRFLRADVPAASQEGFDDSQWAVVTLPHTWNGVDGEGAATTTAARAGIAVTCNCRHPPCRGGTICSSMAQR